MTVKSIPIPTISESTRFRLLMTLFVASSIFSAGQSVSFTPLTIVGAKLSGGEALATVPTTILLIGRALIAYPIGWLMERLGRRLGIGFGYSLSVIGMLISVAAIIGGSFWIFCLGSLLNGMGRGTGEQARYAGADIETPERSSIAVGWIVFAGTIGGVLGPFLFDPSQRMAELWNLEPLAGPYILTTILGLVAMFILVALLFPDPKQVSIQLESLRKSASSVTQRVRSQSEIFADPTVRLAVITLAVCQFVMTFIMVINPLHMKHLNHTTFEISLVTSAHIFGMFGLAGVVGMLIKRYGRFMAMVTGACILLASAILSPLANTLVVTAVALFLLGLGWSFAYVAASSMLTSSLSPAERPRTQGISETLVAVAGIIGSLGTGPTYGWGGILAVSMTGLVLSLFLVGLLLLSPQRQMVAV